MVERWTIGVGGGAMFTATKTNLKGNFSTGNFLPEDNYLSL